LRYASHVKCWVYDAGGKVNVGVSVTGCLLLGNLSIPTEPYDALTNGSNLEFVGIWVSTWAAAGEGCPRRCMQTPTAMCTLHGSTEICLGPVSRQAFRSLTMEGKAWAAIRVCFHARSLSLVSCTSEHGMSSVLPCCYSDGPTEVCMRQTEQRLLLCLAQIIHLPSPPPRVTLPFAFQARSCLDNRQQKLRHFSFVQHYQAFSPFASTYTCIHIPPLIKLSSLIASSYTSYTGRSGIEPYPLIASGKAKAKLGPDRCFIINIPDSDTDHLIAFALDHSNNQSSFYNANKHPRPGDGGDGIHCAGSRCM
jgi:hypothetical protein